MNKGIPRKIEYRGKTLKLWGVYKDAFWARQIAGLIGEPKVIKKFSKGRYAVYGGKQKKLERDKNATKRIW